MGCSCKNAEKLNKVLPFQAKQERKGIIGALNRFSISFVNKVIVVVFFIILTPIVIMILTFNFLLRNKLMVTLPKFMGKFLKKVNEDE